MKKPRVWFASELFYPEDTSTGYFLTGMAVALSDQFQVGALCAQPTYSGRGVKARGRERYRGIDIYRVPSTTLDKDFLPFKILNLVTICMSLFLYALLLLQRDDVVVVVTNPPLLPFLLRLVGWLRGAKVVLLVHDVYPDVLGAVGFLSPESALYRLLDVVQRRLIISMDGVIVLGRDMKSLLETKVAPETISRLEVIPNWGDVDGMCFAENPDSLAIRDALGIRKFFVVEYCGNLGRTHDIELMARCAERMKSDDVHFLVIGFGYKKRWLEEFIAARGLSNITILPPVQRERLGSYLLVGDVAVIPFISGMAGLSVPSRMYNCLAAGRPLIAVADRDSEIARVVDEESVGWVVSPGDLDGLQSAISQARSSKSLSEIGMRARAVAVEKYSCRRVTETLARYLQGFVG